MSEKLGYVIQIFTGGFKDYKVTYQEVEDKLQPLLGVLPIRLVIAGWKVDVPLYKKIRRLLKPYKIALFLWLPVFSEIGDLMTGEPIVLYSGKALNPFHLNEGEGFDFLCPSSKLNLQNVLQVYETSFEAVGFEGVFLDRIRYPSFSNGFESIFSCFCPRCEKLMEQSGVATTWLKNYITECEQNRCTPINNWERGFPYHQYKEERLREFFDFKHSVIRKSLEELITLFRKKSLKIGLDVFAPSIADFIGQDILALSAMADFIKPMMYFQTFAPAGISYEMTLLETHFGKKIETLPSKHTVDHLSYKDIAWLVEGAKCKILPGFEVNYIKGIAKTSIEYIEQQLSFYESLEAIKGVTLSWNLLDMPQAHLEYILSR